MSQGILVVDDDLSVCRSLMRLLRAHGYRAIGAADATQAMEQALRERPAVIVLDLVMPGKSGIEAARCLRREPLLSHIPLIALGAEPQVPAHARRLFRAVLSKPCTSADLLRAVQEAVS